MQLIAPEHLKGRHSNREGKTVEQVRERDAWIEEQLRAGRSHREIAAALGIGTQTMTRIRKSAGLHVHRPDQITEAATSARDRPQRGKQTYLAAGGERISLSCPDGDEGEITPLAREETKPRFSHMIQVPDRTPAASPKIRSVIAAIREMHEQRDRA